MEGMFYGCSSISDLDLSNFNMENCYKEKEEDDDRYDNYHMFEFYLDTPPATTTIVKSQLKRLKTPYNVNFDLYIETSDELYYECENISTLSGQYENYYKTKISEGTEYSLTYDQSKWFPDKGWVEEYSIFGNNPITLSFIEFIGAPQYYTYAGKLSTGIDVYYYYDADNTCNIGFVNEYGQIYFPEDSSELFAYEKSTYYNFSNVNTSKVKNMEYMFKNLLVEELDLSKFNTSNVTNMCGMFMYDSYLNTSARTLKTLTLSSSFKTYNVADMSYMFFCCSSLKILNLSSFSIYSGVKVDYMLNECSALEEIHCPYVVYVDISLPHTMYRYVYSTNIISSTYAGYILYNVSGKMFSETNPEPSVLDDEIVYDKIIAILSDEKKRLFISSKKKEVGGEDSLAG